MRPAVFAHPPLEDHALLDSGDGQKLERFGEVVLARPDPQALWRPRLARERWEAADLAFVRESDRGGRWEARSGAHPAARGKAPEWEVRLGAARALVRPTPFKHVGVFPEQAANWRWVEELGTGGGERPPRLLNLFGYTGVASVLAARAGWDVTHVDASRASLAWAQDNARAAGLAADALRVVLDDALAFARREARRGSRYRGVLVDPPHHGRGPKGERWRLETGLAPLVEACAELLDERSFLVLSVYAVGYSPLALLNLLEACAGGEVEAGELALPEAEVAGAPARLLPCGFCARWRRGLP
jgi:23S rRNA (cytosine1962-C5)-methyltransferase